MKAGETIRIFSARDGRKVVLRTLRWEDLDDLLELINSLVEERANINRDQRVSREEEIDWLSRALVHLEREEVVYVVAEVDGKVVANSEISRRSNAYQRHIGTIGIAIKDGFRDLGIGTEMMRALIEQARIMGLKVLTLTAFANNARAIHVYEKVRFVQTGKIPNKFFKEGKYVDEVIMTKTLE
jgi:RimJ/RimL family protein N-acetyltransferase